MSALLEIKPCPFCGSRADIEEAPGATVDWKKVAFAVGCQGDECCPGYQSIATFSRRSDAIEAWNRRVPAPAPEGWKLIESAPKDGKDSFLALFKSGHIAHVYLTMPEPPLAQTYRYAGGPMNGEQAGWPTHWQPLPSPPRREGEATQSSPDLTKE